MNVRSVRIEELLRDGAAGRRALGTEAMDLQKFLERACGSRDLGPRVIFLGFTHLSVAEYGSRQSLGATDQNRVTTVDSRFRKPDIAIRLKGFHDWEP